MTSSIGSYSNATNLFFFSNCSKNSFKQTLLSADYKFNSNNLSWWHFCIYFYILKNCNQNLLNEFPSVTICIDFSKISVSWTILFSCSTMSISHRFIFNFSWMQCNTIIQNNHLIINLLNYFIRLVQFSFQYVLLSVVNCKKVMVVNFVWQLQVKW